MAITPKGTTRLAFEKAYLDWIAADAFTTDPSYDRPADQWRINKLAQHWKDGALGVVTASLRGDGRFYLLDGQHRVGAMRKLGRKADLVPALVFEGLSVAEEANLFVIMNANRRALSPSQLFKASLVEGDPGAIEIQKVLDGCSLTMETYANNPRTIRAVATVWRVYRALGPEGLDATLSLALLAWGDPPPPNALKDSILTAIARMLFLGEGRIDLKRFQDILGSRTPDQWTSRSDSLVALQGGDRKRVLFQVLLDEYNKGLRKAQVLDAPLGNKYKDPFLKASKFDRMQTRF